MAGAINSCCMLRTLEVAVHFHSPRPSHASPNIQHSFITNTNLPCKAKLHYLAFLLAFLAQKLPKRDHDWQSW